MIIPLIDIIQFLKPKSVIGETNVSVHSIIKLDSKNKDPHALMWGALKKNTSYRNLKNGILICEDIANDYISAKVTYLIVDNARRAFLNILEKFFVQYKSPSISQTAIIHESVRLHSSVFVGEFVIVEEDCTVGQNVCIDHHTVIKAGTCIGDNVIIGSNNVIGGVGFGYERGNDGNYDLMPHLGNVILEDYVEIGNNTCIDRAVLGSTILKEHVKVDNLVHIAHGVEIGRNSLIIANAMIAGSVKIEENVWVAPSTSILNKTLIGKNALLGMGAVILKTVEEKAIVVGNPGKMIKRSQ